MPDDRIKLNRQAREQAVLEAARQWARCTYLGCYVEQGVLVFVSGGDNHIAEGLLVKLQHASRSLLAASTADEKAGELLP